METCDALLSSSYRLQVALDRGMEERLVQFYFSPAYNRLSHCGLLYKPRSIGVGQFLSIVSEILSGRR